MWQRPRGEPVLKDVKQAVESLVREFHVRCCWKTIESHSLTLVIGLASHFRAEPGQWVKLLVLLLDFH